MFDKKYKCYAKSIGIEKRIDKLEYKRRPALTNKLDALTSAEMKRARIKVEGQMQDLAYAKKDHK